MALPKHRISKSRKGRRRASCWKLKIRNVATCPNCDEPKLPHHVCPSCGFYKGRKVLEV